MTNLSLEAKAVRNAAWDSNWESSDLAMADVKIIVAAALRAVAYQVAEDWNEETCDKILRIANELENN
jgi:hypothetical protein